MRWCAGAGKRWQMPEKQRNELCAQRKVERGKSGEKGSGGGPSGTRTPDLGIKSPLLYQLS